MGIYQDNRLLRVRLKWLRVAVLLVFSLFWVRVWQLMILEYERYSELARLNHVRTIPLPAPRGIIYDREGRVLVDNTRSFDLVLFRDEAEDLDRTLRFLSGGLDLDEAALRRRLEGSGHYAYYQPLLLKENLSLEDVAYLLAHQLEYEELRIFEQPRRIYLYGALAAHVLGYVGEVSEAQLKQPEFSTARPGDVVGQFGLERTYDRVLSGRDGRRRILVNSLGKTIQELGRIDPVVGRELTVTLDLDLQMLAEAELEKSPGAVVAYHPRNGEILVMASRPAFDPNQFATRLSREDWKRLTESPDSPFQNRVIQSAFSPGSTFKVVMALAGLERGLIDSGTTVYCGGGTLLYGHFFRCWKAEGHGRVDLREAIRQSCNVYFYLLGQKLSINEIAQFSRRLGLGLPTGIDLVGEAVGVVPSERWKRETMGQPWYAGETISVSIGQGPLTATPLQLARAIGILATGETPPLHLLKDAPSDPELPSLPTPRFSADALRLVRDAMWSVVNEAGTGVSARVAGFDVCGKTGSAQTIGLDTRARLSGEVAERYQSNAWFVGFAPRDHAEIVVAVIVQRGGAGGASAAPLAGKMLRLYFEKKKGQPLAPGTVAFNQSSGGVF